MQPLMSHCFIVEIFIECLRTTQDDHIAWGYQAERELNNFFFSHGFPGGLHSVVEQLIAERFRTVYD